MARKKRQTYNDMVRMMEDIQKEASEEKNRMAGVLASELDYGTAMYLGDLSDAELRRVADLMFAYIGMFVNLAKLNMPKAQQAQPAEDASMAEGELRYNHGGSCWDVWDTETGERIGTLRNGMCVELLDGEDWKTVEVRMSVMDIWSLLEKSKRDMLSPADSYGMFDGLRVRFHKARA